MTRHRHAAKIATLLVLVTSTAFAADLVPVRLTIANAGATEIGCRAAIAHWFSAELGTAATGGRIGAVLMLDPSSGTVFLENAAGDLMPVESIWCGAVDRTWATRSLIDLPRVASPGGAILVTCEATKNGRIACR